MQDNEGFKMLRDAFARFASQYNGQDLPGRIVRSAAAGAKAAVDQAMTEFPKDFIGQMTQDLYTLITSQEIADGISQSARFYDEEQLQGMLDKMVSAMKDPEKSIEIAKKLKDILAKVPAADLGAQLEGMMDMANVPMIGRMIFMQFFSQIQPLLDSMKYDTDEEVAAKLADIADQIPTDLIASQIANLTREITPERVSQQAHDLVAGMPSPEAISDIVHGIAESASDAFGQIAQGADAKSMLMSFAENAKQIVSSALNGDDAAKKNFPKKGQKFDFD